MKGARTSKETAREKAVQGEEQPCQAKAASEQPAERKSKMRGAVSGLVQSLRLIVLALLIASCAAVIIPVLRGGITLARIPSAAKTGVDFISSGALTHSVKSCDISMDIVLN